MKKLLLALLILTLILLTACSKNTPDAANTTIGTGTTDDTGTPATAETPATIDYTSKLTEIDPYIFEVEEYTTLDYEYADKFYAERNENWGGGCSAISKMVDGHRLVGRNMDQNISNKCAYIIRTNAGKYRTVGFVYTHRDYSPDYKDIQKNGISEEFYKALPFMCDDVLNDAGLHIEINMRHEECWPNGEDKFACSGTNPKSSERVYMFELPRYIGENCATVEEAKKYVASLDVYSQNRYWNYCFLISDAQGHSSLLEFSTNEVHWLDEEKLDEYYWLSLYNTKAIAQANFYLNELAWYMQDIKSGEGRYITLQNGIDDVKSRSDMYDLMRKVQYSSYYLDYDECKNNHFDPRSEALGEISWAVYDVVMDDDNEETARELLNLSNEGIKDMSRQEKQDINKYWESVFTEVVDVDAQEIFIRIFENEDRLYLVNLDETKKLKSIEEWK